MQSVQRLISIFIPSHYQLNLTIHRPERTFDGVATISGHSVDGHIMLHAKHLDIDTVIVDGNPAHWVLGTDDEVSVSQDGLGPGDHEITIAYHGIINDQLHGIYPCTYELDGEKHELLATQFESHYARNVFPCVDEPEAKATFDLTLSTENNVTVLGNMPIHSQEARTDSLITTFQTTPRMSTYLVAFVIGDLQKKTGYTKEGTEVNVYATRAQSANSLDFALTHAIQTIEFFNDYFGVPYPLPKSDQVALPDFANGAMENWGLITYRESALLYDPEVTSIAAKQYIATVISHELSHQWFGNLVTMKWWDDLWLNESFATVMEYVCVDALHPEWNAWLDFKTSESVMALRRDSLEGVQAVKVDVHHPDEIQSVFDGAIVYAKGARLMRMMQRFVGEHAFRDGLQQYFTAHAYANTTGDDLWTALETTSGKPVGAFMNTWLTQSGFPLVSATSDGRLSQKQFFSGPHQPSDKIWPIPLDVTIPADELMSDRDLTIPARVGYRLNAHDDAHFITNYDDALYRAIIAEISSGQAELVTRAQLLKEQTLLAKSDEVTSASLIDLLAAYHQESDEKVWGLMSSVIGELKKFVELNSPAEHALKRLARSLARPLYDKLGWEVRAGESEDDTMLRATIVGTMLYGEDEGAITEARHRYQTLTPDEMDAELRCLILIAEVRHGVSGQAIDALLALHRATASVDLQQDICSAVASTRDPEQRTRLIGLLKDTSLIRTQDTIVWVIRLLSTRESRDETWDWVRNEWSWIKQTFDGDKSYDAFPRYCAQILSTRQQLDEYRAFFGPMQSDTALTRAITVGLADIEARVHLIETDKAAVESRLLEL